MTEGGGAHERNRSEDPEEEEEYESSEGEVITKASSSGEVFLRSDGAGSCQQARDGQGHQGEEVLPQSRPSSAQTRHLRWGARSPESDVSPKGKKTGSKRRALWHAATVAGATVALAGTSAMNSMRAKWKEARSKSKSRRGRSEEESDGSVRRRRYESCERETEQEEGRTRRNSEGRRDSSQERSSSRIPFKALHKRVSVDANAVRAHNHF